MRTSRLLLTVLLSLAAIGTVACAPPQNGGYDGAD